MAIPSEPKKWKSGFWGTKDKEVTAADVNRVIDTAKAVNISTDQRILHVITQQFLVDKQGGIIQPVGMSGVRLEVRVHIVTGEETAAQNILKCVRRCGLEPYNLTLNPLAASQSCLTEDEKKQGVLLIDIGAGTTDIAVYQDGSIRHTHIMDAGGELITSDLSHLFRIPNPDAEELKLLNGIAKSSLVPADEVISLMGVGDREPRTVKRELIGEIICSRLEEIFFEVGENILENEQKPHSIVLTGGTALLPGIVELAEDIFELPVRAGVPLYDGSLADVVCQPQFATVMGLLKQARIQLDDQEFTSKKQNLLKRIWDYILNWTIIKETVSTV